MDKKAFKEAVDKLKSYFNLSDTDIKDFLAREGADLGNTTELLQPPDDSYKYNLSKLDQYFSIFNDAKANIALSKQMSLLAKIYNQLHHTSLLINKLAQEQKDQDAKDIVLAKLMHFNLVKEFFNPSIARDFFCYEDEAYYRICDAKKALKLVAKKNEISPNILDDAICYLNKLEKRIIEERFKNGGFSQTDAVLKLQNLKDILFNQKMGGQNEILEIINKLNFQVPFVFYKESSDEEEGSDTNFHYVLDEFFDMHYKDMECLDEENLSPKIDIDYPLNEDAENDYERKFKGRVPIFFLFKKSRSYLKKYINEDVRKNKDSQEFKEIICAEYDKIKVLVKDKYDACCKSDSYLNEKIFLEKVLEDLEYMESSVSIIKEENISRNVRKSLRDEIKKEFKSLNSELKIDC